MKAITKKKSVFKGKNILRNVGTLKVDRRKLKGYASAQRNGKYNSITIIGSVSLPYKTRKELERLASKHGMTMSAYIRYLIDNKKFP